MAQYLHWFIEGLQQTNPIEFIAVITSVIYVILAAKNSIWCWPASMISVIAYIFICWENKLHFETLLQFYYVGTTLYGWRVWKKQRNSIETPISFLPVKTHITYIVGGTVITLFFAFLAQQFTAASMPLVDAFTTVFALIATLMVARRNIENWLYWIVIDGVSIYLYGTKELHLSSLLFVFYFIMAIIGFAHWRKLYNKQLA